MTAPLDALDAQLIDLLKVNARLPIVKLAKALGCARSTAQLRLKALEDSGVITGYTVDVTVNKLRVNIQEPEIMRALAKRHDIIKLYTVSGRYDLCAMLSTESTHELDPAIDKMRLIEGVVDTFSTILLSIKLDRLE
jgi:DNA-binding Lrp family transcriptional regulator